MKMISRIINKIGSLLAEYLSRPASSFHPTATCDLACLTMALRPGDVILVEGNARISTAIKYLTQSTWSHAALYVGPIEGRMEADGEPHVLVEAELNAGVISSPVSKYSKLHTRICRPVGLSEKECAAVVAHAVQRIGHQYDMRNLFDLARYLLPNPPVPSHFRRHMLALGSGSPTRAICSSLIAQAFQSVRYPILPTITYEIATDPSQKHELRRILHIHHHSLFAPRDFDISPYFNIIKPTIEMGFDYRKLVWSADMENPNPDLNA